MVTTTPLVFIGRVLSRSNNIHIVSIITIIIGGQHTFLLKHAYYSFVAANNY